MTEFRYQAVDASGAQQRGTLRADDAASARDALRARDLLPISVAPFSMASGQGDRIRRFQGLSLGAPMSLRWLTQVTRQLASLVSNDIRIEDALATVARQGLPQQTAAILVEVRRSVVEGQGFSEALAAQGGVFPKAYVAAVAAGEASGNLDKVLEYLADHSEIQQSNRQTVQLALIYPAFLALVSGAIIVLLLTQVVPDVVGVYQRRGTDLPFATKLLISISGFLRTHGLFVLFAMGALLLGGRAWVHRPAGRLAFSKWRLRAPLIGGVARQRQSAEICSTLAMLIQSGVPLVTALRISSRVTSNAFVSEQISQAAEDVEEGASLDRALAKSGIFPPMMLAIVSSAIRSGQLGPALERSAKDQQTGLDARIKAVVTLLEPSVLLAMGMIVLFIVLAILTPIVNLNTMSGR